MRGLSDKVSQRRSTFESRVLDNYVWQVVFRLIFNPSGAGDCPGGFNLRLYILTVHASQTFSCVHVGGE